MKKVFYILNLLFLTLFVFGGSVFAAAPTEFVTADGEVEEIDDDSVEVLTAVSLGNLPGKALASGWYYINGSPLSVSKGQVIIVGSNQNVNIVVSGSQSITIDKDAAFLVPESATLNFWAAPDAKGTDAGASLTITGNRPNFIIGNASWTTTYTGYSNGNFGNITFNSGSYTLNGPKSGANVGIGSPDSGGGTVAVNPEAVVNYSDANGGSAISVPDGEGCNLEVTGGLFDCTSSTRTYAFGINVGTGSVKVSGQGKILSLTDPNDWANLTINSGIIGYGEGGKDGNSAEVSTWNAFVGGEVILPPGDLQQDMAPPANPNSNQWNSITINPGADLTLGTPVPGSTTGNYTAADFFVGSTNSYVDNFGSVTINDINQGSTSPWVWNNNPGSSLTIAQGQTLNVYDNFINDAAASSQDAGQVTLSGTIAIKNQGNPSPGKPYNVQNNGNMIINSPNSGITGGGGLVNGEDGTAELTGTLTLTAGSADFDNYGILDIGPIGTVNGGASTNLINEAGGTVTSQNPCFFWNIYFPAVILDVSSLSQFQNSAILCKFV